MQNEKIGSKMVAKWMQNGYSKSYKIGSKKGCKMKKMVAKMGLARPKIDSETKFECSKNLLLMGFWILSQDMR